MHPAGYIALAMAAASIGTLGGIGGAVLLVPALVFAGVPASEAAPLGLVTVAAASISAAPHQLRERSVNHRIGITTEVFASTGAVVGALLSSAFSERALTSFLAVVALAAALAGAKRGGFRNPPDPACTAADVGERIGSLSGAYPIGDGIAPYTARRLPLALSFMTLAGLVAGLAGASGGFVKTPATSEIMHIPTKVATATTTFTVGITSAAALLVFAAQGRIDVDACAPVIVGAIAGGWVGARSQSRLPAQLIRRALSVVLVVVAAVLLVQA